MERLVNLNIVSYLECSGIITTAETVYLGMDSSRIPFLGDLFVFSDL